ncbi:hypothetical protein H310_08795 [Aphanomyces invadans]|uniref:Nudix hydrolase domain-containing protein n=1 Tax=Aphanomyces invadans TaxID=157072 RepID=A0A024TXI6_9STRA|nr:hypothetical protein H310_08795 [Aphanomyces invadans]ETV98699.1 hypothetical protein H310_08795 [Aphanomyces invadans]|eukprot:XP_008872896.1 hypothetical protein H310_08795 [Aphanomyces invadans]
MKSVREAASVVVFNELEEILFVKRPKTAKAWANMMVFPGGKVDAADNDAPTASPYPHVPSRFFNAAIRELFEEVDVSLTAPRLWTALTQADRRQWRHRIVDDKDDFGSLLRRAKCAAQVDELLPFSHVITPEGSPHRFDTWFFLARITGADVPHVETHNSELDGECLWLTAQDALAGYSKGLFAFATPQLYLLHQFRQFESTNKLWATAKADAATGNIPTVLPQRLPPSDDFPGTFTVFPGDPLYRHRALYPIPHRMHLDLSDPSKSTFEIPRRPNNVVVN